MNLSNEPTNNFERAIDELTRLAPMLGVELSALQLADFKTYLQQLQEYNAHTNIFARTDEETIVREHFADSLTLLPLIKKYAEKNNKRSIKLIDLGSGGGFPALVLAIADSSLKVHMIESTGKKANFLKKVVELLKLQDRAQVHNERAEEMAKQAKLRAKFDIATSRAVGRIALVSELTLPFLQEGGCLLIMKSGAQVKEEMEKANVLLSDLGGRLNEVVAAFSASGKDHVTVAIGKKGPTPAKYPRTMAEIKKSAE